MFINLSHYCILLKKNLFLLFSQYLSNEPNKLSFIFYIVLNISALSNKIVERDMNIISKNTIYYDYYTITIYYYLLYIYYILLYILYYYNN